MAKKDWGLTGGITAFLLGATDQQLLHQSGAGNLGPITPAQAQGGLGGLAVVAGGVTKLLAKKESVWTRMAEGGLFGGAFALGQSGMHQADRLMANKAANASGNGSTGSGSTAAVSTNSDSTADASVTSTSADSTQDISGAITSSSDLSDAFNG